MPEEWRRVTVADVAEVNPEQLGGDTPAAHELLYLDIASVESTGHLGTPTAYQFSNAPSRARRRVRIGDILVSTVRPYLRSFAQVRKAAPNLVASTGFAVIRPLAPADSEFLYQHVLASDFVEFLRPRMKGGNYPAVTGSDVASYSLALPPPPERLKIATILSSVDHAIDASQAVIDQLQAVKKAMMAELLTKGLPGRHKKFKQTEIGIVPAEWDVVALDSLTAPERPIAYGILKPGPYVENGVPMLRITDIKGGWVDMAGVHRVSDTLSEQYKRTLLRGGETVISLVGTIGVVAYVEPALKGANVHRNLGVIVPGALTDAQFLALCLDGPQFQRQVTAITKGGNQPLLNLGDLRTLRIPLPPREEQVCMRNMMASVNDRCSRELLWLKAITSFKSALMSVLLTGEVRVRVDEGGAA